MIFIDASFYLSLLKFKDTNHEHAVTRWKTLPDAEKRITSQAILGEVLTVGSMRYNRKLTIAYVEEILSGDTQIILETQSLVSETWKIFKKAIKKDMGWVDCFSAAIIKTYKIQEVLTFDKDFLKLVRSTPASQG